MINYQKKKINIDDIVTENLWDNKNISTKYFTKLNNFYWFFSLDLKSSRKITHKIISDWIKNIVLTIFFLFVLYLSIQFPITAYNKPTAILRIPFSYVDLAVVLFFISIIIRSIQKIMK